MTCKENPWVCLAAAAATLVLLGACSDGSSNAPNGGAGMDGGGATNGAGGNGAGLPPAYLLSTDHRNPDGGRFDLHYILDDLDPQTVDSREALETSRSISFVYGGRVYVATSEDRVLTRYDIDANNRFVRGPRIGFSQVVMNSFRDTWAVVSDTRAFAVDIAGGSNIVVEWNPTTMEIVDTLELNFEELVRDGFAPISLDAYHVGDQLVIPVAWYEPAEVDGYFSAGVIRIPIDDWSNWEITEDNRCGLAVQAATMSDGTVVLGGDQYFSQLYLYGPKEETACLLRVTTSDGVAAFDPDFQLQVSDISGDQPLYNMNVLSDTVFFNTLVLDRLTSDPEDPVSHWGGLYCTLWSGTLSDSDSFRERPDLQVEPGSCGLPIAQADGVVYLETGVDWPNISPLHLMKITDNGLSPGIQLRATTTTNLERVR